MTEVNADAAKIEPISLNGNSTISVNYNPDEVSTPSIINVTGIATIVVKGSATILIKCKGNYTVSSSNSLNLSSENKTNKEDPKKENYVDTDGETTVTFDSSAYVYVRGDATVTLAGEAVFEKPNFIIQYVEFLKGGSGFTVVTSIGALNYLLVSAYGSGSYGDLMSRPINFVADLTFILSIYLVTMAFIFSALMFFTETFGFARKIYSKAPYLERISERSRNAALLSIAAALFAVLYHGGLAIAFATIALFLFVSYIALDLVYDAINGYWKDILAMVAISIVAVLLWANAYRDAQKAAFVADAEYCHWLEAPSAERVCKKFGGNPLSYRAKLAN